MELTVNSKAVIVVSVYGPNTVDHSFFTSLCTAMDLQQNGRNLPIIMGGDWNATWDRRNIGLNIDVFQMAALPNITHSRAIERMCTKLNLTDPYRILYPEKMDFSYMPFGNIRLNRSRIDFFLISTSLIDCLLECKISSSPLCKLFDHKNISLEFGRLAYVKKPRQLGNGFLDSAVLNAMIYGTAHRSYITAINTQSAANRRAVPNLENLIVTEKQKNNLIRKLSREYFDLELSSSRDPTELNLNSAANKLRTIEMLIEDLTQLNTFEHLETLDGPVNFFKN